MRDNGKKDKERVKVSKFGLMVHFTKEIGWTIGLMDMEGWIHADGDMYEGEWKDDK